MFPVRSVAFRRLIQDWPLALLILVLAASGCRMGPGRNVAGKPNLIWVMADDLGYGELGCYGQTVIRTPALDRMASEGMRFTQFYAGATVCAPSRSVLMTGQHHGRTRVRGNAGKGNPVAQSLRAEDVTVARMLKDAGYVTGLVGKWGLGDVGAAEAGLPRRQGFDHFHGFLNQTHAHNHYPDHLWRNEEKVALPNVVVPVGDAGGGYATEARAYADDLFAEEALKFVEDNRSRPFFLYWSMVVPHANNERNARLGNGAEVPDFGPYAHEPWSEQDKGQAAMITRLDGYVGRLFEALKRLGLERNTLVVFTSDNGPHNEAGHDLTRFRPAGPFRGIKRALTDGGIRVPFLARWPGTIPPATTSAHVGYFGDWMATAAELAGARLPEGRDSISFVPALLGQEARQPRHEFLYWEFHERGFSQAALLDGRWKGLRERRLSAPLVLHDLTSDPGETRDVAAAHPEIVARLDAYLRGARGASADWPVREAPGSAEGNPNRGTRR